MPIYRARAAFLACSLLAAAVLSPVGALAATNLIQNPGFETDGTTTTMFTDQSIPDMQPYTVALGGATASGGSVVPTGAARSSDVVVVTGSNDYTDGTFQMQGTPVTLRTGLSGGIAFRYRDASDFYGCTVTSTRSSSSGALGGTDTVLKTSAMTVTAGLPGYLKATATGSSLTCAAYSSNGNAIGTLITSVTATDTTYPSGAIGMYDTNTTATAGKMLTFEKPIMTTTDPGSWNPMVITSGRPGELYNHLVASSGTDSLTLYSGGTTFDSHVDQAGIAVTGSTPYTISAQISTANLSTAAQAQVVVVESPSNTSTILSNSLKNSGWTLNNFTFTTQASTKTVTIELRLVGAGEAGFDDLSLSLAPTVTLALSNSSVTLGTISPLTSPITLLSAVTATVVANAGWTLTGSGAGAFSDGTGHTIPLSELAWRRTGGTTFTPFTTTPATITTGAATTGTTVPLDYRLTVGYSDPASTSPYSTTITYIATTP